MPTIERPEQLTAEYLSRALGQPVESFTFTSEESNWARQVPIRATLVGGAEKRLRLKLCLGETFGRSEVDYYVRDYVGLENAPLVRCYDAEFMPGIGYHLLLEDLSETHADRKTVPPTLAHGLALAEALARLHAHRWESGSVPDDSAWERYFAAIRPGVEVIERLMGRAFSEKFEAHAEAMRERWADPRGMTLLHDDVNPTNVLTPKGADAPVFLLDRQPFDWSLTYGVAVYDLAYSLCPWWPYEFRVAHEEAILRKWHETLGKPDYSWERAKADWTLSVERCLHVPIEWCASPDTAESMRWLWGWQLGNLLGE